MFAPDDGIGVTMDKNSLGDGNALNQLEDQYRQLRAAYWKGGSKDRFVRGIKRLRRDSSRAGHTVLFNFLDGRIAFEAKDWLVARHRFEGLVLSSNTQKYPAIQAWSDVDRSLALYSMHHFLEAREQLLRFVNKYAGHADVESQNLVLLAWTYLGWIGVVINDIDLVVLTCNKMLALFASSQEETIVLSGTDSLISLFHTVVSHMDVTLLEPVADVILTTMTRLNEINLPNATVYLKYRLAQLRLRQEHYEEAVQILDEIALTQQIGSDIHTIVAFAMDKKADVLRAQEKHSEALIACDNLLKYLKHNKRILRRAYWRSHVLWEKGKLLRHTGRPMQATLNRTLYALIYLALPPKYRVRFPKFERTFQRTSSAPTAFT